MIKLQRINNREREDSYEVESKQECNCDAFQITQNVTICKRRSFSSVRGTFRPYTRLIRILQSMQHFKTNMDFKYNKKYGKSQENIHESVYGPYMLRTLN